MPQESYGGGLRNTREYFEKEAKVRLMLRNLSADGSLLKGIASNTPGVKVPVLEGWTEEQIRSVAREIVDDDKKIIEKKPWNPTSSGSEK